MKNFAQNLSAIFLGCLIAYGLAVVLPDWYRTEWPRTRLYQKLCPVTSYTTSLTTTPLPSNTVIYHNYFFSNEPPVYKSK